MQDKSHGENLASSVRRSDPRRRAELHPDSLSRDGHIGGRGRPRNPLPEGPMERRR